MSRTARGLEERADGLWMNPADISVAEALAGILPQGGEVAVVGGQTVFDLVGAAGFAEFHLARNRVAELPGGRGLFAACERGVPAEAILMAGGLVAEPEVPLDPEAGVTLTIWARPGYSP